MIEEPYRWLEAIGNRREYVADQIKGGSPVFGVSLPDGILVLGVGSGNSKVFELFDRHALAGLGHPADIEKIRQSAIDAAHLEAFTRAPEDVSLRRLVSFGLSPQLKTNFEQVFSAPYLIELILVELGAKRDMDLLIRLHFDGGFQIHSNGLVVAAGEADVERAAHEWLTGRLAGVCDRSSAVAALLEAWWMMMEKRSFAGNVPDEQERLAGWRAAINGRTVEIGWLDRGGSRAARFEALRPDQVGL